MDKLNAQIVADWLMNEDGAGATDEEFLETIKLIERKIEKHLSDDYTFLDWLKDVIEEIEQAQAEIGGVDMEEQYEIITISELAEMLKRKKFNESIDFSFDSTLEEDEEPSGWFGIKIVDLFDEPNGCIAIGYYGGGATIARCINPEDNLEELLSEMLHELSETNEQVEVVCVDLTSCNGMPIRQ